MGRDHIESAVSVIELPDTRDQELVLEALEDVEGMRAEAVLFIGGSQEDYGRRMVLGDWGQSDVAISLEATIAGRLPRRFEDANTSLFVRVNDVLIPQQQGKQSGFKVQDDLVTSVLTAESGGALLSRVKLRGAGAEYEGLPPEDIARDAFYRVADVGGYDKALIDIEPLGAPLLYFVDDTGFKAQESASDVLSRVLEQVPYVPRDNVYGGNKTRVDYGVGSSSSQGITRTFRAAEFANWTPPQRKDPRYSNVEVYRENEDGTDAYRASADIAYYGVENPPYADTPLQIPSNDTSANGPANAQASANQKALLLGRGLFGGVDLILPYFYPLVECVDAFEVYEVWRDDDGLWDRLWYFEVDAYKHKKSQVGGGASTGGARGTDRLGLSTTVSYTAMLLEEDLVQPPTLVVPPPSSGIVSI